MISTDTPETPQPAPRRRRAYLHPLGLLLALAGLIGTLTAGWMWTRYSGSLPTLDGERVVDGLSAPVRIQRDARGIPTIRAENRTDIAFATGFVHGQDRFFQMDLLRRHAAGELAELFGRPLIDEDRRMRRHRFRHRATHAFAQLPTGERDLVHAYAAGVEAGRRSLGQRPWEYLLLGQEPHPWREEDTALVVFAMYQMLQGVNVLRERAQGLVEERLPAPLARYLTPAGSPLDAPLFGPVLSSTPIPGPEQIDLRKDPLSYTASPLPPGQRELPPRGSNNWAVDARHTAHGGAIVACDMHLHLMVPNIWYRASFVWPGHRVTGATLPGTPGMIVGSNGHIAWGFTNVEGDTSDQIILITDPKHPGKYRTPDGWQSFEPHEEIIRVAGGKDVTVTVEDTIWGPVFSRDHRQRLLALRWVAHDFRAVNLELMKLETATSVEEALTIGPRCGSPIQNLTVADRKGHIGWTIMGRLPNRVGFDGRVPSSWADGKRRWDGFLPPRQHPRIIDPPTGRIWTANNRTVPEPWLSRLGHGGYDHGARAGQIRNGLLTLDRASEADMLAIQLDDRALFLARWQKLMLAVLSSDQARSDPKRAAIRREVLFWGGRASADSVGFRLVRQFRHEVVDLVLRSLTAPCRKADRLFSYYLLNSNVEQSVWQLANAKAAHLLPPGQPAWEAFLLGCVDRVAATVRGDDFEMSLRRYTWGSANRARIQHPLSPGLGRLSGWLQLDMPREPLTGDTRGMPRIQGPADGASQRMAVSPGREQEGYFHMPGGQSGHPLSPHYRDGHEDWVRGNPSPFLPGSPVHVLELKPAG